MALISTRVILRHPNFIGGSVGFLLKTEGATIKEPQDVTVSSIKLLSGTDAVVHTYYDPSGSPESLLVISTILDRTIYQQLDRVRKRDDIVADILDISGSNSYLCVLKQLPEKKIVSQDLDIDFILTRKLNIT